ncbi:hypothetical protein [Chitinophaga sp. S165]|uniref:hypothetical protein n=1 Tax=Chitinophaga sp. S165 TaxID=2135462 RepID=UPI000D70CC3A|nr:hypothetical protein [Chitinophaga sp. S165]PWV51551.1 hypothetical protein C7475_103160 [Chitinophaga sp. S165]
MAGKRNLKIAFITLLITLCIVGASWWVYLSFTFVSFEPLALNDKKELVVAKVPDDFYKNLLVVLDGYHIEHKPDVGGQLKLPLKVANDKQLIRELTEKAQDIMWLYNHTKERGPSFPCKGEGYEGFVLKRGRPDFIGGDSAIDVDLTCGEVALAEQILHTRVDAAGGLKAWHIRYEFPDYYRQYIGYRNAKGEVVVYISLLLRRGNTISQLRRHLVLVEDGGSAYWQVEVNLNTKAIGQLSVNGSA